MVQKYVCPDCHKISAVKSGNNYRCTLNTCGYKEKGLNKAAQQEMYEALTLTGRYAEYAKRSPKKNPVKKTTKRK